MASVITSRASDAPPRQNHRENDIVCHCLHVSVEDVHLACDETTDLQDVMERTGAGTGCMACVCTLRRMLGEKQSASALTPGVRPPE